MPERVVVVGGGVGGLTTALALGRKGHPVTLVERDAVPNVAEPDAWLPPPREGPKRDQLLEALDAQEPAA